MVHTNGVDLSDGQNTPLYSIVNGTVTNKGYDANGFGNYICMKDTSTSQGFLYGHMKQASPLNAGDNVSIGTYVGIEGTTRKFYWKSRTRRKSRYDRKNKLDFWFTY